MRYLLDEMFPAAAAAASRREGLDALAVQEFDELCGLRDVDVFVIAQIDRRVLVTENARDFAPIEATWRERAEHHGLLLTSNRSLPRHDPTRFMRELVTALAHFDRFAAPDVHSFVAWLAPASREPLR